MVKSGFVNVFEPLGAGQDYIALPSTGDGNLRFAQPDDRFPRLVIKVQGVGDILVGDGTGPPISISTGGGGTLGNGLPVYNVKTAYHADNTGATDAASPINQAISDASVAGGGIVFIPVGTYSIASADITLLTGVSLWGESIDGVNLVDNRSSGSTVRMRGADQATPISRCDVKGFRITGTSPGTNSRIGVELQYAQRCVVSELDIASSGFGAWVRGSASSTITACRFNGCSSADASNKGAVHVVDDSMAHSDSIHVTDNVFVGCFEHDVVVVGTGAFRPDGVDVSDNRMIGSHVRGHRVSITVASNARVTHNQFNAAAFDGGFSTPTDFVYLADVQAAWIADNAFTVTAPVVKACVEVDATSAPNDGVTVQANKMNASAVLATAMIWWHNTAPNYNRRGTDIDNDVSTDTSNNIKRVGNPNTVTRTHTYGPLSAREFGAVGDGVAFDGPAIAAWVAAVLATGRQGYLPQGTYLCQSDANTPTLLVLDKSTGVNGQSVFRGDGDSSSILKWNHTLGADTYGNPNSCWNPINCGKSDSIDITDIGFQGPSASTAATINPNSTPISIVNGFGPRVANRCQYDHISVRGFYAGLVMDGQINSGQYQLVAKTDGMNTATVDTSVSPLPPASIIGMTATGNGIPGGTTVTGVAGTTISFSNNFFNGAGIQPLDLAVYAVGTPGANRVQNTDHHTVSNFIIEECRYGMFTRRNSGVQGGGATGTADFTYRRGSIGRCQFAGIAVSEDGYLRDITFDFVHVANIANSFLKEGLAGPGETILPSQELFLADIFFARCKSEGAGNYVFYDTSGLATCQNWAGFLEINGGIEINGQKTHKYITANAGDHTWKPNSGSAVRDANSRITVQCANSNVVTVGRMIAVESQNATIGGNGGDATFVDCAMVETIVDASHFTALVGGQPKAINPQAFAPGASTITVIGNPNVKNQDIGCSVTGVGIPAGTFADNTSFNNQTFDLVDAAGNPVTTNATNDGTHPLTLSLPAQATAKNVRFGQIGAAYLGILQDIDCVLSYGADPTSENIAAQAFWSVAYIRGAHMTCITDNADFPHFEIRESNNFLTTNVRLVRGDQECQLAQSSGNIVIGDPLKFGTNGKVAPMQALDTTSPYAGIARMGAQVATTTVTVSPFLAGGLAPFVVANRQWLLIQTAGPNFSAATVDGGGANTVDGVAQGKYLCISGTSGPRLEQWDGTTGGKRVVAISMLASAGPTGFQKCNVQLIPHYVT